MPLELYQVLEEEYVSMYGPLKRPSSDYKPDDILDLRWARTILKECALEPAAESVTIDAQLSALVVGDAPLEPLADSPAITERGKSLLESYDELKAIAEEHDSNNGVRELRRRIIDDALTGAVKPLCDVRLDGVYAALHARAKQKEKPEPRTALCISGGGIRSATFALGIIQGLASANLLDQFDYLSTVSGGGYIGSWLSSWARRHPRGATGVKGDLQRADNAVAKGPLAANLPQQKIMPEPLPLRHLRDYSNYLSPRLGLLSGDTWTMASLYIRNLLLNLLVLVPLLALALAFPRIFSWLLRLSAELDKAHWSSSIWAWATAVLIALGFAYLGWKRPVEQGQKKASTDGRFIVFGVLPLALAATALAVFWARFKALSIPTQPKLTPLTSAQVDLLNLACPAAIVALVSMTLLPFVLYYWRVARTQPAAQRKAFAAATERWTAIGKKIGVEFLAESIALATAGVLLWVLAVKVFDDPLRLVPTVETLAPIARAGLPASPQAQLYVCFIVPLLLLVFFVQASIFVGLSSLHNEDYDREWWGRAGAWLLAGAAGLALFNAAAVFGPVAFYYAPVILASVGGGAGIAAALLGFSGKTPANQREKEEGGRTAKAGNLASALTVPLFLVALLAAISLGSTWIIQQIRTDDGKVIQPDHYAQKALLQSRFTTAEDAKAGLTLATTPSPRVSLPALRAIAHLQTIEQTSGGQVSMFLIVAAVGIGLSFFIGVNKFSMHALYRNRIIRAYLGASRYFRDPDRFTGFDENDNIKMWELRPELLWSSSLRDVEGLVGALQASQNALGAYLWEALEKTTTEKALKTKIDSVSTMALVENLNAILLTRDLAGDLKTRGIQPPEWTVTSPGQIGYPRAMINRAILDDQFKEWITPMTPPANAGPDALTGELRRGPLHIVNTALNLTSGANLAWQQRMAESFTVSPYHSGSLFLGYRSSQEYGDGISLGTAVTISGAAASPNMGYHSSPVMAFLLTFFNIRLGSWLGNPGPRGQTAYQEKHPTTGLVPLFEELTGHSTDTSKWVYLSDGGHFENLGLYEMVVRRCHRIVLSDGGADPEYTFEDLGNAIRKIRTDLGIPIDIAKISMAPRGKDGKPVTGEYFAFATIRYSAVDKDAEDGQLLYIKPGVYAGDYFPWDVYNYSQESLQFPHEPTSDQFFSESQFESYRALGRHAINTICKNYPPGHSHGLPVAKTYNSVAEFADSVKTEVLKTLTIADGATLDRKGE
ncbi:MAG TPA: patatin-like phospholipase family protein [Thermoanaerobaculia bacterium]|nr:patatin-like phospholipase family protein [Thermoanaerobaculia bacterium]